MPRRGRLDAKETLRHVIIHRIEKRPIWADVHPEWEGFISRTSL